MNQQDVLLVEKQRNNKIIEDNYIVCFLRSCIRLNFLIQSNTTPFNI